MTGATMPRVSPTERAADVAALLRDIALQLQTLADTVADPGDAAAGQALGPDVVLTPDQEARLQAAIAREQRRAKQASPKPHTRRQSAK